MKFKSVPAAEAGRARGDYRFGDSASRSGQGEELECGGGRRGRAPSSAWSRIDMLRTLLTRHSPLCYVADEEYEQIRLVRVVLYRGGPSELLVRAARP